MIAGAQKQLKDFRIYEMMTTHEFDKVGRLLNGGATMLVRRMASGNFKIKLRHGLLNLFVQRFETDENEVEKLKQILKARGRKTA